MKRFRFRLDPVLSVRRHTLEQKRLALAWTRQERDRLAARLETGRERLARESEHICDRMRAGMKAGEWQEAQVGIDRLQQAIARDGAALAALDARVVEARSEVLEAHTGVRAIEVLRERALAAHRLEQERRLQAELDEVASRRHKPRREVA